MLTKLVAGVFANNATSELLKSQGASSLRDMVMHLGDESYRAFTKASIALRCPEPLNCRCRSAAQIHLLSPACGDAHMLNSGVCVLCNQASGPLTRQIMMRDHAQYLCWFGSVCCADH